MKLAIFLAGAAAGYVLGSKSGRQAYDRLKRQVNDFAHSDSVQQVASDVKDLAGKAASGLGDRVGDVVDKASGKLDDLTGKQGSSSSGSGPSEGSSAGTPATGASAS
ncbi:YtxH domain-containing protein [Leifsonia sp. NPDC058248]|uniref:YtxH domain-containing protein n=1 Tax=Leifsonia sp. NPDC058248 TaxID=3346402 RepID=UPI0036DF9CBB